MAEPDLKKRTKVFALRVLKLVDALPNTMSARALGSQIVRSGTSVAANYRAARRAKSTAHFLSKLGDVEEEADETLFWLELLEESGKVPAKRLRALIQEANELVAITVAAINTTKRNSEVAAKSEVGSRKPELKAPTPRNAPERNTSDFRLPTSDFQ